MFNRIFLLLIFLPFFLKSQDAKVFISGSDTICSNGEPAIVSFDFLNRGVPPYTVIYSINDVIHDTIVTDLNEYEHKTKIPGEYNVEYFADSDFSNLDSAVGQVWITVNIAPVAVILAEDTFSVISPEVSLKSNSIGDVIQQVWDYGYEESNYDTVNDPTHLFPVEHITSSLSSIYFPITLFVEDSKGCSDTTTHNILILQEYWVWLPNSFTPDNNKLNDRFCIDFNGIRENTFLFKVYNSQGDLMYQSTTPSKLRCGLDTGWDGTHYDTGRKLPSDLYVYELYFQDFEGWKHQEFGEIILIR